MAGMEMRESMYNILICDDEKDIVNALKIYLNDTNYHFLEAFDGEEAVHVVETKEVHLVLMDIMMPKMDGIQAMIKIRERSNVPVILLTAKGEDSDKVLGLTVGADDYITKPFTPIEVPPIIINACGINSQKLDKGNRIYPTTDTNNKLYPRNKGTGFCSLRI